MHKNLLDKNSSNKPDNYYSDREEMLRFIPNGISTVLDVGCGEGHFGKIIKTNSSVEVWGVEALPEVADRATTQLDKVLVGSIEGTEVLLPDDYFDCIVFNDVLEHFREPWQVLHDIKKSLKEDGVIVASIPNVRYFKNLKKLLIDKEWKYVDAGILDRTHLRFFTYKTILDLFQSSGYQVISIKGINGAQSRKVKMFNALTFNFFDDMRYLQFACVARKREED